MKKHLLLFWLLALGAAHSYAQEIDAAYVKALYKKYPTKKSDFCDACKLWVNPYYKSIADTQKHMPLVTYYVYTKEHRLKQEQDTIPRTGVYAAWHPAYKQVDETGVYKEANRQIGKPNSPEMIAKGHCEAWILLAWCADGAILSDTYTFNAAMEYQGQNVGTEIATEERCRTLTGYKKEAVTDSVRIWCGTFGSQHTYSLDNVSVTVPSHYYKVLKYRNHATGRIVTECYWMPNEPTEKKSLMHDRMVDLATLTSNLGFDPTKTLKD
jgi:DNA/RNA endonuclease G (NUC1)